MGASLVRPLRLRWAPIPPKRQIHGSAHPYAWIQGPYAGDHWSGPSNLRKKVSRCILDLELNVDSDYGAPRGPRASPGRVLSSQRKVTNFMRQGSSFHIECARIRSRHGRPLLLGQTLLAERSSAGDDWHLRVKRSRRSLSEVKTFNLQTQARAR